MARLVEISPEEAKRMMESPERRGRRLVEITPERAYELSRQQEGTSESRSPEYKWYESALKGVESGLSSNWSDEIRGAISALTGGSYSDTVKRLRQENKQAAEGNFLPHLAGEIGGGLGAAYSMSRLASKHPKLAPLALLLGVTAGAKPKFTDYVKTSAIAGGFSGAGRGEDDLTSRLVSGGIGSALGGVGGAGTLYLGSLLGKGYDAASKLNPFAQKRTPADELASMVPQEEIVTVLKRISESKASGVPSAGALSASPDIRQNIFRYGEKNPEMSDMIKKTFNQISEGAVERINSKVDDVLKVDNNLTNFNKSYNALKEELGISDDAAKTIDDWVKARDIFKKTYYDPAVTDDVIQRTEKNEDTFQALFKIIANTRVQEVMPEVQKSLLSRDIKGDFILTDLGNLVPERISMKLLDSIREHIKHRKIDVPSDKIIRKDLLEKITKIMDDFSPEYAEVRKTFHAMSEKIDAMKQGYSVFSKNVPAASLDKTVDAIEDKSESFNLRLLPYFKHGFATALKHMSERSKKPVDDISSYVKTEQFQKKIEKLFGKDAYNKLKQHLDSEVEFKSHMKAIPSYKAQTKKTFGETVEDIPETATAAGLAVRALRNVLRKAHSSFSPAARELEKKRQKTLFEEAVRAEFDPSSPFGKSMRDRMKKYGRSVNMYKALAAASPRLTGSLIPETKNRKKQNEGRP